MSNEILVRPDARVAKDGRVGRDVAVAALGAPGVQDPQRARRHAVDGHVRPPVVVADGDGEPAVVDPDEVYHEVLLARQVQVLALARVLGPVPRLFCKIRGRKRRKTCNGLFPTCLRGRSRTHESSLLYFTYWNLRK